MRNRTLLLCLLTAGTVLTTVRDVTAQFAPTDFEQYMLELINRARANPNGEVTRLSSLTWGDDPALVPGTLYPQPQTPSLNEGLPSGTIPSTPVQPLAFNPFLIQAARNYAGTLLANDAFTHTFGSTTVATRAVAAGYTFGPSFSLGENLAVIASSGTLTVNSNTTEQNHNNLFVDNNVVGRGHRLNYLNPNFREVGLGLMHDANYGFFGPPDLDAVLAAQTFAANTTVGSPLPLPILYLTGVVYTDDVIDDDFYTPGEGHGGITVQAVLGSSTFTTTTWYSGGYSLQLAPGTYDLTFIGPFGTISGGSFTISDFNVKRDLINPIPEPTTWVLIAIAGLAFVALACRQMTRKSQSPLG